MNINYQTSQIKKALQQINTLVPARGMPIKITSGDNTITITKWDETQQAEIVIPAIVHEPGSILVNCSEFRSMVKANPKVNTLQLDPDTGSLAFTQQSVIITQMPTITNVSAPTGPEFKPNAPTLRLNSSELKLIAQNIAPSAADENFRPALKCVHFNTGTAQKAKRSQTVTATATDRYMLATDKFESITKNWPDNVLIQALLVQAIGKVISNSGKVEFAIGPNAELLRVSFDQTVLYTQVTNHKFPDFDAIIPDPEQIKGSFNIDRCHADELGKRIKLEKLVNMVKFTATSPAEANLELVPTDDKSVSSTMSIRTKISGDLPQIALSRSLCWTT